MATILIRISDNPDGTVKVEALPSAEEMIQMVQSGSGDDTSAHGIALQMINAAIDSEMAKRRRNNSGLIIL